MTRRLWPEKLKNKVFLHNRNTRLSPSARGIHILVHFLEVLHQIQAFMLTVIFSSSLNLPGKQIK